MTWPGASMAVPVAAPYLPANTRLPSLIVTTIPGTAIPKRHRLDLELLNEV
jgi:hypothetical protein